MTQISNDSAQLLQLLRSMESTVTLLEQTKNRLRASCGKPGGDWNDKHYRELTQIIAECTAALTEVMKILLMGQKYVALLLKYVQEYEQVNLGGGGPVVSVSTAAAAVSEPDDSGNPFCPHIRLAPDNMVQGRFFSQGSHGEQYRQIWENLSEYEVVPAEQPQLIYVRARDIEGVYLYADEVERPEGFWTRNGRSGWSRERILASAGQLPAVRQRLEAGESLDDLMEDPQLGHAAGSYHGNPVRVADGGGFLIFQGDGRHRTLAAQSVDAVMPVLLTGRYRRRGA